MSHSCVQEGVDSVWSGASVHRMHLRGCNAVSTVNTFKELFTAFQNNPSKARYTASFHFSFPFHEVTKGQSLFFHSQCLQRSKGLSETERDVVDSFAGPQRLPMHIDSMTLGCRQHPVLSTPQVTVVDACSFLALMSEEERLSEDPGPDRVRHMPVSSAAGTDAAVPLNKLLRDQVGCSDQCMDDFAGSD